MTCLNMKLLYLTHTCPFPPIKGDKIRCFNIMKYLSKHHEVNLVYPSFSDQDVLSQEYLLRYSATVKTARIDTFFPYIRCLYGLSKQTSFTVSYFFSHRIQSFIDIKTIDFVIVDCSSMAPYVESLHLPKIMDFVDVDSDKWHQYAGQSHFPKSFIFNLEYNLLRKLETRISNNFNYCVVTTEHEKKLLARKDNVLVIPNGIDLEFYSPRRCVDHNILVFTGAMDYFPNIDAMLYFHDEIFPMILKEIPDVKFFIVGMNPVQKIRRLANENIIVTGMVGDVRDYLGNASVCIIPLRIAKGIQNKILEAMAMQIPVVSTSHANRGIEAVHEREIMIADNANDFAKTTITLLKSRSLRENIAKRARLFVEEKFSWECNLSKLNKVITLLK
jgi:sugar transferase (PEP-CTERM/EpsH1 system associated)